ncbi:Bug family tripartite tricarboxylate transporter substrate binding protein [Bordetella sp. 2513F-2]
MNAIRKGWTRQDMLGAAGACAAAAVLPRRAAADRPVRFILPVSVGSGVDTILRSAAPALSKSLGHTVVVENQPGAGGVVGTSALVRSDPDGYTLGMVSNNHVIFPSVYKSLPFDPLGDITPISMVGRTPFLLVTNPRRLPVQSLEELAAALRARPGEYNYASSGNGTILHLAAAMFLQQAGLEARHIPYKGAGPMLTDLLGGQVDLGVLSLPSILAQVRDGGLNLVGCCGAERIAVLPQVPTLREQGLRDYDVTGWVAVVGPARLPAGQVQKAHAAFSQAFRTDEVRKAMDTQGNEIVLMPPDQTTAYFRSERDKYARAAQAAGLQPA